MIPSFFFLLFFVLFCFKSLKLLSVAAGRSNHSNKVISQSHYFFFNILHVFNDTLTFTIFITLHHTSLQLSLLFFYAVLNKVHVIQQPLFFILNFLKFFSRRLTDCCNNPCFKMLFFKDHLGWQLFNVTVSSLVIFLTDDLNLAQLT